MKRSAPNAFTLIEMLTVMAVIALLASLIVAVNAFAHKKAAVTRAQGEIAGMSTAAENYKADFGGYPRDETITDTLDPKVDSNPSDPKYQNASLVLYKALSGDAKQGTSPSPAPTPADKPDGRPETKSYFEFQPSMIRKSSSGELLYIQDPFGNSYGYSTAGAAADEEFRAMLQADPKATRNAAAKGYNPTFDLWCTGGLVKGNSANANDDRKRWVKNW